MRQNRLIPVDTIVELSKVKKRTKIEKHSMAGGIQKAF